MTAGSITWRVSIISGVTIATLVPWLFVRMREPIPGWLLREDGLYEWAGALACLAGGVLALNGARQAGWRSRSGRWLVGFAVALLFLAGEELSWGQRLLGLHLDVLRAFNFQGELNLHNARWLQPRNGVIELLLNLALSAYLIVIPLTCAVFPPLGARLRRTGFPLPGLAITVAALIAHRLNLAAFDLAELWELSLPELRLREALECALQFCLLAVAIDVTLMRAGREGQA